MIHLVHRDEKVPTMGTDVSTFYARAACGQHRGFGSENDEVQCASNEWVSEVTCGRCRRIYEHWKRINALTDPSVTTRTKHELAVAVEWGFRASEKGWNLDYTLQEFAALIGREKAT